MGKGGIHGKAVMVCQCMPIDTLQSAVTGVTKTLNNILVGHSCGMEGTGHVMPVIMQAGMREAIPFQKP